jgi:NitT/TauT family transport system permease protein
MPPQAAAHRNRWLFNPSEQSMQYVSISPVKAVAASTLASGKRYWLMAIVSHIGLIVVWQLAVDIFKIPSYLLASPLDMLGSLTNKGNNWWSNAWVTTVEIYAGFALATVVGVLLALLFVWSKGLRALAFPLFVTLNMIPKVALGPLIIMWLKYGIFPNMLIAFVICIFPILLNTVRGLMEVEPDLLDLVRSLKGSRWQLFTKIQFPGALPYIFSGMKISAVLAVAGAIVGEFIASDRGLGYLIVQAQSTLDSATMMMALTALTLIGVLVYGATALLERVTIVRDARVH